MQDYIESLKEKICSLEKQKESIGNENDVLM